MTMKPRGFLCGIRSTSNMRNVNWATITTGIASQTITAAA